MLEAELGITPKGNADTDYFSLEGKPSPGGSHQHNVD